MRSPGAFGGSTPFRVASASAHLCSRASAVARLRRAGSVWACAVAASKSNTRIIAAILNITALAEEKSSHLIRGLGLLEATSANMLEMVGVGPFLTIPLMLASMGGPHAMLGWLLGAVVAICDGLVWAELGAAMPGSGGPYHYLSEAYGPRRLGRLMSFLFIWETVCLAPLSIGSGAVGFAQYVRYLWPGMSWWEGKAVAMAVCLVITVMLYRDIRAVGRLSVMMWA